LYDGFAVNFRIFSWSESSICFASWKNGFIPCEGAC
jgi:hypothetical protein